MLRNQTTALLEHEHVQTTVARAKELRPFAERIISIAKRSLEAKEGSSHAVAARRNVARDVHNREVVTKLFDEIAPRYVERPGGYTRMLRLGYRRGDSAEVAIVELIGSEYDPNAVEKGDKGGPEGEAPKKKGLGARMREAIGRGGKKGDEGGGKQKSDKASTKGAGRKITAPRKAGGS
jgi:large subunit ribosomal protein L17